MIYLYELFSLDNEQLDWNKKINHLNVKDIFYSSEYCSLYKEEQDGKAYLFVFQNDDGREVYYCFFKREVNDLPFMKEDSFPNKWYDIITVAYGYGGPLTECSDEALMKNFRRAFEDYCQKENIITEFIRFHPLLQNQKYLKERMEVIYDRETVYIDLSKTEEEIFQQYHKNHQRNVKKALKNELEFRVFHGEEALLMVGDFYDLYKQTMDKLNAAAFAYFSPQYIHELLTKLRNKAFIGAVFYQGRMIAAALCMYEAGSLHYHLGCSDQQFLPLGTNVFLLHNIALYGKSILCRSFHLGGGHVGRDSLFQFKYRFNPTGTLAFFIGKKIHHAEKYEILQQQWENFYRMKREKHFFPAYRYVPKNIIVEI